MNLRRHFGGKNQQKKSNLELNGGVDSEVRADRQWEVLTHKFTQSNSLQKKYNYWPRSIKRKIRFEGPYCEMQTLGGIASNCI